MVALAFMSMESFYLIRGALGKSLWESAGPSTSQERPVHRRRRGKVDIFLQVVDPHHGCVNLALSCFLKGSGQCSSSVWREFRRWPQMGECQTDITNTVDLFVVSKRPKAFNNVCVLPTKTPLVWLAQKVIDKRKMPPTESLLAVSCLQRSGCPEWKWLTWLAPGDAHPCVQSH